MIYNAREEGLKQGVKVILSAQKTTSEFSRVSVGFELE